MKNQFELFFNNLIVTGLPITLVLLIGLMSFSASAQTKKMSATLIDEFGGPLPGVNIFEEGTKNGVTSGFDGKHPILVKGVHAYSEKSIFAGDTINFRVSADVPYEFSIAQLGENLDNTLKDVVLYSTTSEAIPQKVHVGSYIKLNKKIKIPKQFLVEIWIRPFGMNGSVFGDWLTVTKGEISFLNISTTNKLKKNEWYHIVVKRTKKDCKLWVNGSLRASKIEKNSEALEITEIGLNFDGDISQTTLYSCDNEVGISKRFKGLALDKPSGKVIANWNFKEEKGLVIHDDSGNNHDGVLINNGTWMIGGPSFKANKIDSRDETYNPLSDPRFGHSIRLASDDLYDCKWPVSHKFQIPKTAKQGVYVGRLKFEGKEYNSTFIVKKNKEAKAKKILVVCATNTWLAYGRGTFANNYKSGLINWGGTRIKKLGTSNPLLPSYNMYETHKEGQPTYQLGVNMPWPVAGPYKTYRQNNIFSQWTRCERFLHLWLDKNNYEYDVITDLDIDKTPSVVKNYKAVIVVGHSEYWSSKAYDAIEKYTNQGGNLVVLSGNSVFWRVSYNEDYTVMECRKFPQGMASGNSYTQAGHLYHAQDKKKGGLMRFCGYPAWQLIGLETAGWSSNIKDFDLYTLDKPKHFLLNTPNKVNLEKGDKFGYMTKDLGCVGHEYDVRLPVILGSSKDKYAIGEPKNIVTLASCYSESKIIDYNASKNGEMENPSKVISEIIYWKKDNGGKIFNIGSVAAAMGVYYDENLGLLMKNVLYDFLKN